MCRPIARDLIVAVLATFAFICLALTVLTDGVPAFDVNVRSAVHSAATPFLTLFFKSITRLGSGWFLWACGAAVVFRLARQNRDREAALFVVAFVGASIMEQAMKLVFQRVRPEPYFDYALPSGFSFPSGHAFISFCFYLTLAEILVQPSWRFLHRAVVWTVAAVLTLLIGCSRVYLGVHYPTDVLAGYAGAIGWSAVVRAAHQRWWHQPS